MMEQTTVQKAREILIASGMARPQEIRGCTESEIRAHEESLGTRFPKVYYDFLEKMGRSAGKLFLGSDAFYPTIVNLRCWAIEILQESSNGVQLPNDAVVFLMHQGYVLFFFRTSDGEDPPVYRIIEGDKVPQMMHRSFSDFLMQSVETCIDMARSRESYLREHGRGANE